MGSEESSFLLAFFVRIVCYRIFFLTNSTVDLYPSVYLCFIFWFDFLFDFWKDSWLWYIYKRESQKI